MSSAVRDRIPHFPHGSARTGVDPSLESFPEGVSHSNLRSLAHLGIRIILHLVEPRGGDGTLSGIQTHCRRQTNPGIYMLGRLQEHVEAWRAAACQRNGCGGNARESGK